MVHSLLLAALALAGFQNPAPHVPAPIVLSGALSPGRCRVWVDLAGDKYLFLVDTGMDHSYIRPDLKQNALAKDPNAKIAIADASVPVSKFDTQSSSLYRERPYVGGLLGMDILGKLAFTIDYDSQQVTVWPPAYPADQMEEDLGKSITKLSLLSEPNTTLQFFNTSLGLAQLDTGAAISLLPKTANASPEVFPTKISQPLELFEGVTGKATQSVVRKLAIGDQDLFCQMLLVSDTVDVGVISPNIFSRKVLFDFPNHQIEFSQLSSSDQACRALGAVLHSTVEDRNGEPYMRTQSIKNLGPGQFTWVRVVSINGHKGHDLLTMLENKDLLSATILQNAYDSLANGGTVIVDNGSKQERLYVAPFIH